LNRSSFVRPLVDWFKTLAIRHPWWVILVTALLACVGGYVYVYELDLLSERGELSDDDQAHFQRFEEYKQEFGRRHERLVLAVSAGPLDELNAPLPAPTSAQRDAMKQIASQWAEGLRQHPSLFPEVVARMPLSDESGLSFLYLPMDTFRPAVGSLRSFLPVLDKWAPNPSYERLLGLIRREMEGLSATDTTAGAEQQRLLEGVEQFFRWSHQSLSEPNARRSGSVGLASMLAGGGLDPQGYLFTGDGRLLTAYAGVAGDPSEENYYGNVLSVARQELQTALERVPDSVHIEAGLTGRPAIKQEESQTTQKDFTRGTLLAFLAVTLLFIWGFRNVSRPALAVLCLGFSIGITFLVTWLTLGHLNMIAMVFAIILVALGIDFAIHFFTHYQRALAEGASSAEAIRHTYDTIGGALWMDGLATATAFWAAYFTDFPGLSELGLIAGSGLLICLICMVLVYPAMLYLLDTSFPSVSNKMSLRLEGPLTRLMVAEQRRTMGAVLILIVGLTLAAGGFWFGQYSFDTNLLNLQPTGGEAFQWQQRLLETDTRSTFALATYRDLDSLREAQTAFEALPRVAHTESVIPSRAEEKRALLAPACSTVTGLSVATPAAASPSGVRRQLFQIRQPLRSYRQSSAAADSALAPLSEEVTAVYRALQDLPGAEAESRLTRMQDRLVQKARDAVPQAQTLLCPPQFSMDRVPSFVRDRLVGSEGTYALQIYPDGNAWEESTLAGFLEQTRSVDAQIFGLPVNFYENAQTMIRSFGQSALYSSLAILALLLVWTRSIRATLLAVLPLVAGLGVLLGVMEWMPYSLEWNFANFFAVPILIGVGVASGVHLVQAWRSEEISAFQGAVRAVVFSSLTTMTGFGLLATSAHLGIRSLGLILLIGITLNLVVCLLLLPTALRLFASSMSPFHDAPDG